MKKWLKYSCFVICVSLLFSFTACGPQKENGTYDQTEYHQYQDQSKVERKDASAKSGSSSGVVNDSDASDLVADLDGKNIDVDIPEQTSAEKDITEESQTRESDTSEAKPKAVKKDVSSNQKSSNQSQKQSAKKKSDSKKSDSKNINDKATNSQSTDKKKTNETSEQGTKPTTTETVTEAKALCSLTIDCSTILNNKKKLKKGKDAVVPGNGLILQCDAVEIQNGDTVMDILLRELKARGIPVEYSYSPVYKTDYVEGINNLYEMDCGSLSGWMYEVNGTFPNYGASAYKVQDKDKIGWHFTCNGGSDVW